MSGFYVLLTSWPDIEGAREQAGIWLDKKMAANVNILPRMDSIYRWKGEIRHGREHQVLIKTSADRVEALEQEIRRAHPYPLAEILRFEIDSDDADYLDWIKQSTR